MRIIGKLKTKIVMKKSLSTKIFGVTLLMIAFIVSSGLTYTEKDSKHPPGTCKVMCHVGEGDLQLTSASTVAFQSFGVLPDCGWSPELLPVCRIKTTAEKASPKTARQILYGLSDVPYSNPERC